tara:strand:- start:206 stop:940 length:735 start_codon:yes stop_codon:yes gene_type:complete
LVCVKSYDSQKVADEISNAFGKTAESLRIVLCQNGWGNAEIFAKRFPRKNVFSSRVITGFFRPTLNRVEITVHAEAIHLGSLFSDEIYCLKPLARAINGGGIPCQAVLDIEKDLIAKLLYNCALNPLGAIFRVPYGILGEFEMTRELMFHLVEEVFQVLGDRITYWVKAEEYMTSFYQKILPPTARHESSMLQDIRAGKKTEIDSINGAVVKLGRANGISTLHNSVIFNMIKFLEERSSSLFKG